MGGPRQQRGGPRPHRRNGQTRLAARARRCARRDLGGAAGEGEIGGVEFPDHPAGRVVVARRCPAGGIVARQRQPGQAERGLHPTEVGIDRLDRTDEMQRRGASALQPEKPFRIAVRKEVRLRPDMVEHEFQMAKRNPQGTVAPLGPVAEEGPRLCAPEISGVGEQLGAELGEFAQRAVARRMVRDACRAHFGVAVGMAMQGEETAVRIAQEREGEIAGVELEQARDLLDALRQRTPVPVGAEGMASAAMGNEPVQHRGPCALGLIDVDASVAVRDHGRHFHARPTHRARRGSGPGRRGPRSARQMHAAHSRMSSHGPIAPI